MRRRGDQHGTDISDRYIEAHVLELAILGLLKEQDLHGYELKKQLTETLGPLSSVSFGSLYPALARLEAAGAVKAVEANPGRSGSTTTAAPSWSTAPRRPSATSRGSTASSPRNERLRTDDQVRPSGDRGRRQLRQLSRAGGGVLPRCGPNRRRPRPHARGRRRL